MKRVSRTIAGSIAAGAMMLASAGPAVAQDRDRDRGGIDGGDILAGALVLGGIAAIAAVASNRDDDRYDRRHDDYGRYDRRDHARYNRAGYERQAVDLCVRAAEDYAARHNYGTRAQVTNIRDVDRERSGFEVKGNIAVQDRGRGYRRGGWDEGRFKCEIRRGRVVDIDYSGIRGL